MKFLIVGLIIVSLVLVLIVVTNYQKYQKTIKDISLANRELEKDYESLIDELSQMKKIAESSTTGNYELTRQMADLKDINGALERELSVYKENEVAHQNILKAISDAENELKFRQDLLRENEAALKQLDDRYSEQLERLENAHAEEKVLKTAIEEFHAQQSQMQAQILKLSGEIEEVEGLLAELKETHRLAVEKALGDEGKNGQGWRLTLKPHETKMVNLIDELVDNYPELASDLNGIKWKKIWLPKVQELCVREGLDKCSGIYRIGVKNVDGREEGVRNYIGQAVNVKERWYQHIKKMLGVDAKGSEKLYEMMEDGHIEWCEWELVEKWSGDDRSHRDEWLDERERYWIEFYGAKEWGLNKK